MPNLQHDGLFEALDDFGVDMSASGLVLAQVASPVVTLVDLSLNYKPAIRAKLFTRFNPAASVGQFGGFQLQAGTDGFWVLSIMNNGTQQVVAWVHTVQAGVTNAFAGAQFNIFGDSPGETRSGGAADDFFGNVGSNGSGTKIGGAPPGYIIGPNLVPSIFPFFVPGKAWLNCLGTQTNLGLDVSVALQMPAANPGRLPV